jgi:hypothetical protein
VRRKGRDAEENEVKGKSGRREGRQRRSVAERSLEEGKWQKGSGRGEV